MALGIILRVSDLNLDEDEALKLACLGNEVNSKETIDVLKKSLVIRNKYEFSAIIVIIVAR